MVSKISQKSMKSNTNDESIKMNREGIKMTVFDRNIFENWKLKNRDENNLKWNKFSNLIKFMILERQVFM